MVEVWLFGVLVATVPSGLSVVLVVVALSSVTYLDMTLLPVVAALPVAHWRARALGVLTATGALLGAALGLRIGGPGSGGELFPSLAVGVAAAAASGATAALAALGVGATVHRLGAARTAQRAELARARVVETKKLKAARRAFDDGEDLRAEVGAARDALDRLVTAVDKLASTHAAVVDKLASVPDSAKDGPLERELAQTRDDVGAKLEVGRRVLDAARASTFRLACGAPLRLLLRRRPRDLTRGLSANAEPASTGPGAPARPAGRTPRLGAVRAELDRFLADAEGARTALADLEVERPPASTDVAMAPDPLAEALRDVDAIEHAFTAVRERLAVVAMRTGAREDIDALATAAGEVSEKARAAGIPAADLQALVDEVSRAESAISLATPADLDARSLSDALTRSVAALDGSDAVSLDDLLSALREVG